MTAFDRPSRPAHRREFLLESAAAASGLAWASVAIGAEGPQAAAALPSIQLGAHRISRLVAGYNPIGGYSYQGHHMDQHMREYYTAERTVEFLQRCEREGITAHQFSPSDKLAEVIRTLRERGSKMSFICLTAGKGQAQSASQTYGPIAVAHHGGATDALFRENQSGKVHDFVKEVHDQGLLAGVSAHNPDCIKRIADEGWPVDFFMTCFYYLTCPAADRKTPVVTLELSYPFVRTDPETMTAVVREVKQPCLGFKILGSGRLCASQPSVQERFQFAFRSIKPGDGVIVGMYPRFFDEIRANAEYVRKYGAAKA
jgi:hypothetical protein